MPNVREQSIGEHGVRIVGSDGRVFTANRGQLRALFERQKNGDREQRRRGFSGALQGLMREALGAEQIGSIEADVDEADGRPTRMEVSSE